MTLSAGSRLGVYEISALIGEGGMGQVFRATDTKLKRQVAIKILPDSVAADSGRLARFQREAEVLASLNHPNVAAIYGLEENPPTGSDGTDVIALVMELVEGEDLSQRIARGAIPLDEALPIAKQIAGALEAAHEQGIIHRDLKPANIKVRADGTVKVLDFGLAKALEPGGVMSASTSMSPTITSPAMTAAGMILGTASYMSPEQARGTSVDQRADIWALGVVLWEMLTGRRLFEGPTVSDTLATVLTNEPDWAALPIDTPAPIRRLLRRCLQKDRKRRLADAADAGLEIEEALTTPLLTDLPVTRPAARSAWAHPMALAALATALILSVAWLTFVRFRAPVVVADGSWRFLLSQQSFTNTDIDSRSFAISPDGRRVVYEASSEGVQRLYLRDMQTLDAKPMVGTENGEDPFFSPDSRRIGFWSDGSLKVTGIDGGPVVTLVSRVGDHGASWAPDDTIIYSPDTDGGLFRVSADGGTPERLAMPDSKRHERSYRWPYVLPGGDAVLFTISASDILSFDDARIGIRSLRTGEQHELLSGASFPVYAAPGYLLYARAGTIQAVRFNVAKSAVEGPPTLVLDGIATYPMNGAAQFSVSNDGTLLYVRGHAVTRNRRLTWIDRTGHSTPIAIPPAPYQSARISPDGRLAAVDVDGAIASVWILEFARSTMTRLTLEWSNNSPFWTPDGSRIAFTSARAGVRSLYWQPTEGHAEMEQLTKDHNAQVGSFSPDGRTLAFAGVSPDTDWDIWIMSMDGNREVRPFNQTKFIERAPAFSPNGRWLAYVSNETGKRQVYAEPYPGPGHRVQISTDGGMVPVWSRDGREVFFRMEAGELMSVKVNQAAVDLSPEKPERLFTKDDITVYDVAADGRFLTAQPVEAEAVAAPIAVLINWREALKSETSPK